LSLALAAPIRRRGYWVLAGQTGAIAFTTRRECPRRSFTSQNLQPIDALDFIAGTANPKTLVARERNGHLIPSIFASLAQSALIGVHQR